MAWTGLNLTAEGRIVLNKAQLNNKLNFKSIVVGDGNAPTNFSTQKELVNQLYELENLKINVSENECTLTADLPVVDYDYYLREIGIIVTTDNGDKLYAYDNCGDDAQYIVNTTGVERTEKRIRLALVISGVDNITVSTPSILYVDYKDYEETVAELRQTKVNVVGGDISNTIIDFKQADTIENIKTGEKASLILGKISKAIDELMSHLTDKVKHITPDERTLWNTVKNKVDSIPGKGLSTNDYSTAEKNKLSGIAEKANNYVHPVSHPADIITQDATHRFVSDDEKKVWNTNKSNVDTHVSNNTIHITSQERTKWNKVTDKLDKTGGAISGDIVPDKTEAYDLGHEDKKWDNVWVETLEAGYVNAKEGIQGNLTGNADTATKAVKDSAGDNIITSYRKRMGNVPNNDFNDATVEGVYTYGSSTGIDNAYTNGGIWGILEVFNNGYNSTQGVAGTIIHQIAFTTNNQIYFRQRINTLNWTAWKELTTKFSNGEIKVTNPAYSKGYVRAWVDNEGGNLEIQSPNGKKYQIDSYSNDLLRLYSQDDNGNNKFAYFNRKTGALSADGGFAGNASTVNGHTVNADVPANAKFTDTNTTYAAGTGIGLSNTTFYNAGVRGVATGSKNGTLAINTNGTVADVQVKGLGALAYASGTWNKISGTNCTIYYNEVAVYLEISAQNVNLKEYGGTATNKTIVVLPTNVIPTKGAFLGAISALNSAWVPLNKTVVCDLTYNSRNLILRPAEALSNVTLNLTAIFPRSLFTIN